MEGVCPVSESGGGGEKAVDRGVVCLLFVRCGGFVSGGRFCACGESFEFEAVVTVKREVVCVNGGSGVGEDVKDVVFPAVWDQNVIELVVVRSGREG